MLLIIEVDIRVGRLDSPHRPSDPEVLHSCLPNCKDASFSFMWGLCIQINTTSLSILLIAEFLSVRVEHFFVGVFVLDLEFLLAYLELNVCTNRSSPSWCRGAGLHFSEKHLVQCVVAQEDFTTSVHLLGKS